MERLCRALESLGLLRWDDARITPSRARGSCSRSQVSCRSSLSRSTTKDRSLRSSGGSRTRSGPAWPFARAPLEAHPYAELAKNAEEYATFLEAMGDASRGVGDGIARLVPLSGHLVDLGGGGGDVARDLLRAAPSLTVESFDLAPARDFAARRTEREGLASRHVVRVADVRVDVPTRDADAVLLSAVLADFPASERAQILATARRCLKPGGVLLVSETLLDDDQRGPVRAAILSVVLLAAMRGDQLSAACIRSELQEAGFIEIVVHRGEPRDLVVARRG